MSVLIRLDPCFRGGLENQADALPRMARLGTKVTEAKVQGNVRRKNQSRPTPQCKGTRMT
ncbi:hypothetical protein JOE21_003248 [Desmospora profundinema]|uniref:Uncharacterized protein n=1 Tax=Desmospora profundinema TaxID=1571184 RepID=A0ABU1IR14_9BACL|nr:hypothetical protein [Desmospora profundinema]